MTKISNSGVFYGLIAGVFMVVFSFILYRQGVDAFIGRIGFLAYAVTIGLAVAATLAERRANGGGLEFQPAVKTAFTVFVIALTAQTLFTWILVNFIDTHFRDVLNAATLNKDGQVFKGFGAGDEDMNRAIADQRMRKPYTLGALSLALAFACILHFMIALVIAAIVKKKKIE